jgi:hypothetical protein
MGRLIDADALLERWKYKFDHSKSLEECIKTQPTAFDVEKVVEELENERKLNADAYDYQLGKEKARSYEHAIHIVRKGGVDG